MRSPQVDDAVRIPRTVQTIAAAAPLAEVLATMTRCIIHHLVVVDADGLPLGIVSERDLLERGFDGARLALRRDLTASDVMTRVPHGGIDADARLAEAAAAMRLLGVTALPVVRAGELAGILTETDLMRLFADVLAAPGAEGEEDYDGPAARSRVLLSNPVVQSAMELLANAGI